MSPHPISCRCGKVQAEVAQPELGVRATCYCRDCQAFAHFLGLPEGMLDPLGGTDIVAVSPRNVTFRAGTEHLACMSLSANGILRWYTRCCRTPIGNTPRDFTRSHVGLVHTALERSDRDLTASFGPVKMLVHRQSAHGPLGSKPAGGFALTLVRYLTSLAWSRVSGKYRVNPFFDPATRQPRVQPQVLTSAERQALVDAAGSSPHRK
jgi:hypothetical protein